LVVDGGFGDGGDERIGSPVGDEFVDFLGEGGEGRSQPRGDGRRWRRTERAREELVKEEEEEIRDDI